jgi:hypothetical protein
MPMFLGVAAIAVEIFFWMIRTRHLNAGRFMLLTGAVTGFIVAVSLPLQQVITDPTATFDFATVVTVAIIGIPFGVLAGFLSGRFITMLRALAPARKAA